MRFLGPSASLCGQRTLTDRATNEGTACWYPKPGELSRTAKQSASVHHTSCPCPSRQLALGRSTNLVSGNPGLAGGGLSPHGRGRHTSPGARPCTGDVASLRSRCRTSYRSSSAPAPGAVQPAPAARPSPAPLPQCLALPCGQRTPRLTTASPHVCTSGVTQAAQG